MAVYAEPPQLMLTTGPWLWARAMPEKTSFFYPKPRTGLVFRALD